MKQRRNDPYTEISSFRELRLERERLDLKAKLTESKIRMDVFRIRQEFSISSLIPNLLSDLGLPSISDILGYFRKGDQE